MNAAAEYSLTKIAEKSIAVNGQINDLLFGIKELSGKLDTLIALKQVELGLRQQQREQQ